MSNSRSDRRRMARARRRLLAESTTTATVEVSDRAWSDFSQADYTPAQWRRACLIDTGVGDPGSKSRYKLPVREPSGEINRNGVFAAAAVLAGARGGVDATPEQQRQAARALVRIYRSDLDMEPPESLLRVAGMSSGEAPAREAVQEAGTITRTNKDKPGRMLIRLIKAGWSANNRYYPAEVLRRDGPRAFPQGTLAFVDHATEEEDAARPAGSIRNLAAVLSRDAWWDEEQRALVGELRLFKPWRDVLTDMAEHIGMSIRSWVIGDHGEAEGRNGFIVREITEGRSVDFVTVPAAGGAILSVLESAGHEMEQWDDDQPTAASPEPEPAPAANQTPAAETVLDAEIGGELAALDRLLADVPAQPTAGTGPGQPDAGGSPPTVGQKGEALMSEATQDGARAPDKEAGTMTEARMDATEARVAVVERALAEYRERAHSLAAALTEARNAQRAAEAERDRAVAEMRRYRANEAGRQAVNRLLAAPESGVPEHMRGLIGPRVHERIHDHVPLTPEGEVDQAALESLVDAAIKAERVHAAQLLEAQGVGHVSGLGVEDTGLMTTEQFERQAQDLFADLGMDETTIKLAVRGR